MCMKPINVIFLFSSIVFFVHCNSAKKLNGTFKAKLVASLCNQHIVEIQESQFYKLGTDWKEYKHVFTIGNHCDFVKAQLKVGDVFTCKILKTAVQDNCMSCEAFMETPKLKRNVEVVQ